MVEPDFISYLALRCPMYRHSPLPLCLALGRAPTSQFAFFRA